MTNAGVAGYPSTTATGTQAASDIRYRVDPLAVALGYINWNWNNAGAAGANSSLTSQRADATAIAIPPGVTVSTVYLTVVTAGTSTVPTGFFVGLCSATKMLAQSTNLASSTSLTATGAKPFALNGSYTTSVNDSPTGLYYVVALQNGAFAGTNVAFMRGNAATVGYAVGGSTFGNIGTGLTALPASGAAVAIGASGLGWHVGVA